MTITTLAAWVFGFVARFTGMALNAGVHTCTCVHVPYMAYIDTVTWLYIRTYYKHTTYTYIYM